MVKKQSKRHSRRKSAAQMRHLKMAKEAMMLFKSGEAKSLKSAWRKVKK